MNEKRLLVALFGVAVAAVAGYIAYRFVAAITVAVFVYYSTRPVFRVLRRAGLPRRPSAALVILFLGVPLVVLIGYTILLLFNELRLFVEEYPVAETAAENVEWFDGLEEMPELTFQGMIQAYQAGQLDAVIEFSSENLAILAGAVTGFFLNLLIVLILTYYLLIDGWRARRWLLRFDDDAIVRDYLEAVDRELEKVLFGNLLNVIAIAVVAIAVFNGYNAFVPAEARVPYPALAGVLTGIASLIPVVGMKIVYVPLAVAVAVPAVVASDTSVLVYVAVFVAVTVIFVDTIPDLVLRPYLSGDKTHVGLLMLAYIFGPIVFGFHGLFLAPIILVLGLTFAETALPRLLGAEEEPQVPGRRRMPMDSSPPSVPRHGPGSLPYEQRSLEEFSVGDERAADD